MKKEYPIGLLESININDWTFAKTAPENPHYYAVRKKWIDESYSFNDLILYIKHNGIKEMFWKRDYLVCKIENYLYWTMEACYYNEEKLLSDTIIINRRVATELEIDPFQLSETIQNFVENTSWTFAKTYADTWAHWYIVQEQVDNDLFLELASFIDTNGYQEDFYSKQMTFFDYGEHTYWHMENIINRCLLADTYHQRVVDGRLPK